MEFQTDLGFTDLEPEPGEVSVSERCKLLHAGAGEAEFRLVELLPAGSRGRRRMVDFLAVHSRDHWRRLPVAVSYVRWRQKTGRARLGRKRMHDVMADQIPGSGTDNNIAELLMLAVSVVAPDTRSAFLDERRDSVAKGVFARAFIRADWKPAVSVDWENLPAFAEEMVNGAGSGRWCQISGLGD